jgi:hypothetical protein
MLFCLLRRTFVLCYCHANAYLVLTIGPLRHFCLASRGIARICTWGAGGGGGGGGQWYKCTKIF